MNIELLIIATVRTVAIDGYGRIPTRR